MRVEDILNTHPQYEDHAGEADFFYRSYVGGKLYQKGEYLTHYLGEENSPGDAYLKRVRSTPLDNHVKTVVDIYSSFVFRNTPKRTLGNLQTNPQVNQFVDDIDQTGQDIDSFMKSINDLAMVMGNVWLLVDKPSYAVETQAQELAMGIRAYVCAYTPQNVLDWSYHKSISGKMILDYIKVIENESTHTVTLIEWYTDTIHKYVMSKDEHGKPSQVLESYEYANPLGMVPFINYAPTKSPVAGIGYSLVGDVAYAQKYIYNLLSELEQNIRISGHPSLVKTPTTRATAGAGAIIEIQEDMDPGLKPYLLQPGAQSISGILSSIDKVVDSIARMTHTSAVQTIRNSPLSGVALQTERQLLNTKLADISHTLQETEYAIWKLFFAWQGFDQPADFDIQYADTFDIRDEHSDLELYRKALETVPHDMFKKEIHKKIADMLIDEESILDSVYEDIDTDHDNDDIDHDDDDGMMPPESV